MGSKKSLFLISFFSSLFKKEVDYFVLGTYDTLPNDTGSSDIDIVASEDGMPKIESIFHELTEKFEVVLASYYENYNTKFYRFLGKDWGVQIDVFYKGLCYQGCPYYPVEALIPYVKTHNEIVQVLDRQKGYFVDFFKEVIHNGRVKEKYIDAVLQSFTDDRKQCENTIRKIYGNRVLDLITNNLTPNGLNKISSHLQEELQQILLKGKAYRVLLFRLKNLLRLFQKRPGYVIVVEGTDGSGKSTIINHITPILNECFHDSIEYRHLRPHAIPDMGVVLGNKKETKQGEVCSDPHAGKQSGLIGSLIRWTYYMIDYTLGYLKSVWPHIHTKSKVFIFDRYYYDYYIDQKRSRTMLPIWVLRIGEWLIPTPDLILCLGGDPLIVYNRKPETSKYEVERQTQALRDFCNKRKNSVWIDTTQTIEQSSSDAMAALYKTMSNRFKI